MKTENLRELDAFCAEFVMGWNPVQSVHDLNSKEDFCVSGVEQNCWIVGVGNNIKKFSPTENPADAMRVLAKCAEEKCDMWGLRIFPPHKSVLIQWTVREPYLDDLQNPVIAEADTLPIAICLFAKALYSK